MQLYAFDDRSVLVDFHTLYRSRLSARGSENTIDALRSVTELLYFWSCWHRNILTTNSERTVREVIFTSFAAGIDLIDSAQAGNALVIGARLHLEKKSAIHGLFHCFC